MAATDFPRNRWYKQGSLSVVVHLPPLLPVSLSPLPLLRPNTSCCRSFHSFDPNVHHRQRPRSSFFPDAPRLFFPWLSALATTSQTPSPPVNNPNTPASTPTRMPTPTQAATPAVFLSPPRATTMATTRLNVSLLSCRKARVLHRPGGAIRVLPFGGAWVRVDALNTSLPLLSAPCSCVLDIGQGM